MQYPFARYGAEYTPGNEAELERASSWPVVPPVEENGAVILDPTVKEVFPWQAHNEKDFHFYFGREGVDIKDNYLVDRKKYEKLLEETAKKLPDQNDLRMMEGFGWHWTLDFRCFWRALIIVVPDCALYPYRIVYFSWNSRISRHSHICYTFDDALLATFCCNFSTGAVTRF